MLEADLGQPEGIIEQIEWKHRRQASQQDDLSAFGSHSFIDCFELFIPGDLAGYPIAGQIPSNHKSASRTQSRSDLNGDRSLYYAEQYTRPHSHNGPRQHQHAICDVKSDEDQRPEVAKAGNPSHRKAKSCSKSNTTAAIANATITARTMIILTTLAMCLPLVGEDAILLIVDLSRCLGRNYFALKPVPLNMKIHARRCSPNSVNR